MNKKTLLYVAGAVAVVGLIVWYKRSQAKKRAMSNSSEFGLEEETSGFIQQIGTTECSNPNNDVCKQKCEQLGGEFSSSDRKCWKNGQAITGGVFGGTGMAMGKNIVKR